MKKKKIPFRLVTSVLLSASAVLLIGSTVGAPGRRLLITVKTTALR